MAILDAVTTARASLWRAIGRVATNPIVLGSLLGTIVSVSGVRLPPIVMEPAMLIANACVPIMLIAYGISLHGQRVLGPSGRRRDIVLASSLKLVAMPVIAWALAAFVFGLAAHDVLVVTVLAALPTAQNVFNYSQRYDVGETISRDTVFLTTIGCVPVLILVTLLLG
jgi:malonate transporter